MSSATHPPPPPTTNTLDARQRARLIRSTRKLGAVLGQTPQLAEHDSTPPLLPIGRKHSPAVRKTSAYAKRRQGSVFELPSHAAAPFYHSASSASSSVTSLSLSRASLESTTSLDSTSSLPATKSFTRHVREKSRSKGKHAPLPTPLVLRLNAVPLPPSDPRLLLPLTPDSSATLTFAHSASASSSSSTMLPTTPTTPATPTATETRRKRLAKLKRTLGENVPPELILPFRSTPSRSRHSSASTSTSASPSPVSPPPPPQSYTPPPFPPAPRAGATLPRPPPQQKTSRRRSMSVDFHHTASDPGVSAPSGSDAERRSSRVWITGNGNWTGEWNRRDIREVQQQLRALRAR
ncbi:hypothetical protein BV20DRAFT_981448 [Pilatotrama ljubarskyi]|nr:hypothetical protein BV20DRAFT_981448 [Pilatotrama ljubarskyi]